MDKTQALQNLLNGTASEEEINPLKQGFSIIKSFRGD
jgi:hypothetical protein